MYKDIFFTFINVNKDALVKQKNNEEHIHNVHGCA